VDAALGLRIAQTIRDGEYDCIPQDVPIVIFTARRNQLLSDDVERLGRSTLLVKPLFSSRVEAAIQQLFTRDR